MHIVSTSEDRTAWIWNAATGECKAKLKGHSKLVRSATFSPDGKHIVSASYDKTARIWNTVTGECEAELKGHSSLVRSAVFSPDGMHVVSASDDYTARLWNATTGECEAVLEGHTSIPSLSDNSQVPFASSIPDGVFTHSNSIGKFHVSLQPSFLDIYNDTIFHTISLHKIWIPPPFRKPSSISCYLSKICLGYESGEILVLEVCMAYIISHIVTLLLNFSQI
ncbi:WD40 repeat-like protein [Phlegmacium glaucopus]|nr:WD40 repeat-like protein [Phlegmacium glaucopus]